MSRPITEPTFQRRVAGNQFAIKDLQQRPAPNTFYAFLTKASQSMGSGAPGLITWDSMTVDNTDVFHTETNTAGDSTLTVLGGGSVHLQAYMSWTGLDTSVGDLGYGRINIVSGSTLSVAFAWLPQVRLAQSTQAYNIGAFLVKTLGSTDFQVTAGHNVAGSHAVSVDLIVAWCPSVVTTTGVF